LAISAQSMTLRKPGVELVVLAAAWTTSSLPDIGYEPPRAVADLDSAHEGSKALSIDLHFDVADSSIRTANDEPPVRHRAWMSCCTVRSEEGSLKTAMRLQLVTLGSAPYLWSNQC
jgi:hypothetical protein